MNNMKKKTVLAIVYMTLLLIFMFTTTSWYLPVRLMVVLTMVVGYHFAYKHLDKPDK